MGSRITTELKLDGHSLWLYSHWGGESILDDLQHAIKQARPRWSDDSYCLRIIVSQLIGEAWNEETGYGLAMGESCPFENSYFGLAVDIDKRQVETALYVWTFQEFTELENLSAIWRELYQDGSGRN